MTTKQLMAALTELGVKYKREFEEAHRGAREATSEADEILCNANVQEAVCKLSALCEVCDELELWDEDEAAEIIADEYVRRTGAKEED